MKNIKFDNLLEKMSFCESCTNMRKRNGNDCSLINVYKNQDFCRNIPSIWTDWYNRLNSDIMIIGQDWGPYSNMKKLYDLYIKNPTNDLWKELIESEKSLTKRMLTKYLIESASLYNIELDRTFLDTIFITNAIMCARSGEHYRGDDIKLKECTIHCSEYLKEQIKIVMPKIILTLGYYPLFSLSKLFDFEIEENLTKTIEKFPKIVIDDCVIIPLYHPTAQIRKEKQLEQYSKIWKFYKKRIGE